MAAHAVPSIEELMELKVALEREKLATKTIQRKLNLKKLADRNQKIRPVVQFFFIVQLFFNQVHKG